MIYDFLFSSKQWFYHIHIWSTIPPPFSEENLALSMLSCSSFLFLIVWKVPLALSGFQLAYNLFFSCSHVYFSLNCFRSDESRQPLSRKMPIASSMISPYRIIILLRLVILGFFFQYRLLHPVPDAYGLWLTSVICEIWFAISWILDQFPKWFPIERETYLDRLSLRYEFHHHLLLSLFIRSLFSCM